MKQFNIASYIEIISSGFKKYTGPKYSNYHLTSIAKDLELKTKNKSSIKNIIKQKREPLNEFELSSVLFENKSVVTHNAMNYANEVFELKIIPKLSLNYVVEKQLRFVNN